MMNRRTFVKTTAVSMAALKLGGIISLSSDTYASSVPPVCDQISLADNIESIEQIPTVCLNCSTVCGMIALVKNGVVLGVSGNPLDPNTNGKLCAKAHGGVSAINYPERLLYPLKRVGKRGDGLWQRITMDEAHQMVADRIKLTMDSGHPERVVFHAGRNRIDDITNRFMDAIGSPVVLNHRALCSSNKRAANYISIGDTDWETVDAEYCRYFLNFGANFLEAHQGGFPMARRFVKAKANGAKMVTFDTRLSNTAGKSDEWLAPFPSSEGAIALAMAHTIMNKGAYDEAFIREWCNVSVEELKLFLAPYTPKFAAEASGLEAKDIERIALEFASHAPACAAFTNRGSQAHQNGLNNDRAVIMLNAIVGSIGRKGGYAFGGSKSLGNASFPMLQPIPPKVKFSTDLEDPKDYPLANKWQKMKVSELVFEKIKNKTQPVEVYMSYTISAPQTWPEGPTVAVSALKDETVIPFHVCSDVVYSEMAHYADLILPDATYFERYTIEGRNANELIPYFVLRQPVVALTHDCLNFGDSLIQIAQKIGGKVSQYFAFDSYEAFIKGRLSSLPEREGLSGWNYMKKYGVWIDEKAKNYEPYSKKLSLKDFENIVIENETAFIYKDGRKEAIGKLVNGILLRGFKTPSRKFEIYSADVRDAAHKMGLEDDGFPHFVMPKSLKEISSDDLVLTTFKWNVHTQARTAPQKYLSEIVHDNPVWINTQTARKYGIKNGDMIEITTYRPQSGFKASQKKIVVGKMSVHAFVTQGIHPRVIAVSNSLGMNFGGRIPCARNGKKQNIPAFNSNDNVDFKRNIWWDKRLGGTGNGVNPNSVIPINPSPLVGMQAWNDTVCSIKKIKT
ncbi:MAG: molybdopterin-dependent oxidoreductase [Sulfuricurvum sp.]|nr:molybdopterin-dependent oxidoreductase [Sulfuricurvum sp.]